jgi:hypothetical protein
MNMPGFTAESTLYRSSRTYAGEARAAGAGAAVVPALPPCSQCTYYCRNCWTAGRYCLACDLCDNGLCQRSLGGDNTWAMPPVP